MVRTDGQFRLYAGSAARPERILGPAKSTARLFAINTEAGGLHLEVDEDTMWSIELTEIPPNAETPDPIPMEVPVEFEGRDLRDEVMDYVRDILSKQAQDEGMETLEEANDFEMDEDDDPLIASPYEYDELDSDNSLENKDLEADNVSRGTEKEEHHDDTPQTSQESDGRRTAVDEQGAAGSGIPAEHEALAGSRERAETG